MSGTGIIWFRADLRLVDNTALLAAREQCENLVAVYLPTPMQWHEHHVAPIQVDLIHRRLAVLKDLLADLNIPLVVREVADFSDVPLAITQLAGESGAHSVFCNKQYENDEQLRDKNVKNALSPLNIQFHCFDDSCIVNPGDVVTQAGEAFKVFTPFRKAWLSYLYRAGLQVQPPPAKVDSNALMTLSDGDIPTFTYPKVNSIDWPVDEEAIRQRLLTFCETKVALYHQQRDIPSIDGTSCLSPYLATGCLSARQCLSVLLNYAPNCLISPDSGGFAWLNELVWREFYRHLLVAYPKLGRNQPFVSWTNNVLWRESDEYLQAWQQGRTGYPIVDAAMRQLKATGWMHNRLRMITASFLTKDLLIDWRAGERWFMSHLIDGDFASNNGGWQWAASTGTDAQPYFRVFNPTTQGERFDPKGEFIRTWVHELKDVPDKYIHTPHLWPEAARNNDPVLFDSPVCLDYPLPIVDHKAARVCTIEVFRIAKEMADRI
ncbi:deoxyribodipyrimidine photolyase [Photobacterium aquae]|uniref:Deoxyribodipyrimidine photo-lyase n=1 Tax=Photobacterium aquae TaxID=1195763 RepID=A0A0J1GUJ8_9GAMM|nr:deoxyribodipyrimidine photo-lyase [Photobacterium aquae]KLV03341.1 deoxyribodipyrimidine photolyase [Photobacterium aquae]